jgi:glutamate racemase
VDELRATLSLPVIGMEPAVKPAAERTRSGVVAVLATEGTLASARYQRLVDSHGRGVRVLSGVCHHWVAQVEAGELTTAETRRLVRESLAPLLAAGADCLVLGCTHFPFLTPLIQAEAGPDIAIIDPAPAVAAQLERRLAELGLRASGGAGTLRIQTTGDAQALRGLLLRVGEDAGEVTDIAR